LITDIVRCSVAFETVSDMSLFVQEWIMKYGKVRQIKSKFALSKKISEIRTEMQNFLKLFGEHFRSSGRIRQMREQRDRPAASTTTQSEHSANQTTDRDFHLFEIHRIRNRLDPALIVVPGGYRDLAFKLKIGFVRYDAHCLSYILSTLSDQFLILKLLCQLCFKHVDSQDS
jgi:hypothetical protein